MLSRLASFSVFDYVMKTFILFAHREVSILLDGVMKLGVDMRTHKLCGKAIVFWSKWFVKLRLTTIRM